MANDAVRAPDIPFKSSKWVPPDPRRWLALAVIAVAQLMVVLDATIVNIALPSAQADLDISDADRQWIVTAYTLTFGGLLLLGGRIADYFGRKRTFLVGLLGFAGASALGGAAVNAEHAVRRPRACRAPSARCSPRRPWRCITVTFTEAKERAKAFGVFGAISGGGAAIGLLLGGVLTEYADWRWCLLVNIPIAVHRVRRRRADRAGEQGAPATPATTSRARCWRRSGLVALVYGFTKAADRRLELRRDRSRWLGVRASCCSPRSWSGSRAAKHPLLPLRVLFDRNRGGVLPRLDPGRRGHARHVPVHDLLPAADAAATRR